MQCNTMQYTIKCSRIQYNKIQYITIWCDTQSSFHIYINITIKYKCRNFCHIQFKYYYILHHMT